MKDMRRTLIIVSAAILLIIVIVFFSKRYLKQPSTTLNKSATPTVTTSNELLSAGNKSYQDPSGFSFSYPDSLTVNNQDSTDQNVYSILKLETPSEKSFIQIAVVASSSSSLSLSKKPGIVGTKLAGMDAYEESGDQFTKTTALDSQDGNILFTVDVHYDGDKTFWPGAYQTILKSFAFTPPPQNTSSTDTNSVVDEGEEVVQ